MNARQRLIQRGHPRRNGGARRQRVIDREALTYSFAGFVGVARKVGEGHVRVAVERGEQHVVTAIEDLLGAVTVMKIHVENRDTALASVQRALGSDGGIIEKAVAAELIHRRVVARRSAQAEGRLASSEGMIDCRQRGIFTCHGSGKGAFRN